MSYLSQSDEATLALGAYHDHDTAENLAKTIHPDFLVDRELSNDHIKVYHNPTLKRTVASVRGTKLSDPQDHIANSLYFINLGRLSKKYKQADQTIGKIIGKYGKDNLSLSSHSLGANVSSDLSKKHDIPTTSFNRGRQIVQRSAKSETSVRNPLDPISGRGFTLVPIPKARDLKNTKLTSNPHGLEQFRT